MGQTDHHASAGRAKDNLWTIEYGQFPMVSQQSYTPISSGCAKAYFTIHDEVIPPNGQACPIIAARLSIRSKMAEDAELKDKKILVIGSRCDGGNAGSGDCKTMRACHLCCRRSPTYFLAAQNVN